MSPYWSRLLALRRRALGWLVRLLLRWSEDDPPCWWPDPKDWPAFPPEKIGDHTDRLFGDQAAALMLAEGVLFIGGGCVLAVLCNDLFWWGSGDAEPIPHPESDDGAAFWSLYDRVRRGGHHGAEVWCCLRRGMRPQTPIERDWRRDGRWTDELEALPERTVGSCG